MIYGVGIGKNRTKLGIFLDRNNISQSWFEAATKLNKNTITRLCGDDQYVPRDETVQKVISTLRKRGFDVIASDFWR